MDGAVEARTSGGWLGHVRVHVSQEIVHTSADAGLRFGEVGGVSVNVEDHVTVIDTPLHNVRNGAMR